MTKLQEKLNENLIEISGILNKSSIPHFLIGGTAIGAFRQGKFLEGDDDIDLGIPEEHMEMAINAIISHPRYKHLNLKEKSRYQSINKVYDTETFIIDEGIKSYMFIDLFAMYKKRDFSKGRTFKIKLFDGLISLKKNNIGKRVDAPWWKSLLSALAFLLPYPKKILRKKIKKLIKNAPIVGENNDVRHLYDNIGPDYKVTEQYSVKGEMIEFEGNKYMISQDLAKNLKEGFGDINCPPKQNEKYNHGLKLM